METAVVGNSTRYYVMAVTPTRLYSFTGIGSLEVSIDSQLYQLQISKTYYILTVYAVGLSQLNLVGKTSLSA
jgi:hypothetical protein